MIQKLVINYSPSYLWKCLFPQYLISRRSCLGFAGLWSCVVVCEDPADLQAICTGRRRTCALLNSPLPCVNKAVNHIQELKMIVKDWCQQVKWSYVWQTYEIVWQADGSGTIKIFPFSPRWFFRTDTTTAKLRGKVCFGLGFEFHLSSALALTCPFISRFQSRDSDTESVMSTELFVEGVAINSRGDSVKRYFSFWRRATH